MIPVCRKIIMRKICLLFLFLFTHSMFSQDIVSSSTEIRTCIDETQCSSINNYGYLFFDESKNEFYLKIDFFRPTTTSPTEDWLTDLWDTSFYFKAHFENNDFPSPSNYNSKTYRVNGQMLLNRVWHNQTIDMTIFTSENTLLDPARGGSAYDIYRVNFSMSFSPKDFKIDERPYHLKNPVFIFVTFGKINLLKKGMEWMVGEAYDHE